MPLTIVRSCDYAGPMFSYKTVEIGNVERGHADKGTGKWVSTRIDLAVPEGGSVTLADGLGSEGWELVSTHVLWEVMSDGTSRNEGSLWGVFKRRNDARPVS